MTFSFDMVIYLLGLAATAGAILARISALEKKVEKHNSVMERTFRLEEKVDALERERSEAFPHRMDNGGMI